MATLVKVQVLESDDGPGVEIPESALILYSRFTVTKVVGCVLIDSTYYPFFSQHSLRNMALLPMHYCP